MTIPPKRLGRSGRIRAINVERHEKNWARSFHSLERVRFIKSLPCSVAGCHSRPSDNAHGWVDGMSRKADYDSILPLCDAHHRELDAGDGRAAFEAKYELWVALKAAETQAAWLVYAERMGYEP
jgi:hypothetical protein